MTQQQRDQALLADGLLLAFLRPMMIKKIFKATTNNYSKNSEKPANTLKDSGILQNTAYCYHCQTRQFEIEYLTEQNITELAL